MRCVGLSLGTVERSLTFESSLLLPICSNLQDNNGNRPAINSGFSNRNFYKEPNQERPTANSGFRILHNPQQFTIDRLPGTSDFFIGNDTEVENNVRQRAHSAFSIGHNNLDQNVVDRPRADSRILIGQGQMQETLKSYIIKARELIIAHGDNPEYWKFETTPKSRYGEVVKLIKVWWLQVHGLIKTRELSPNTTYGAYLVYNLTKDAEGFDVNNSQIEVVIEILGIEGSERTRNVCLDSKSQDSPPRLRGDGWMEIEMGEFFNDHGEDTEVRTILREVNSKPKSGLFIQGIEFRPKDSST
ncbi:hypothetical protein GIB67_003006 [Kingdonia uniflora]|uniref:Uncharacterized protein n=1 Tax=Kingdonia uniflora TaxID=39325 RepID=A0A7J7LYI4_9MAGN|nr:hypothetical protein GIB67_003006 [Kingdonia uniflora]